MQLPPPDHCHPLGLCCSAPSVTDLCRLSPYTIECTDVQGVIVLSHLTASSRLDSFISTHRGGPGMAANIWSRGTDYSAVDSLEVESMAPESCLVFNYAWVISD